MDLIFIDAVKINGAYYCEVLLSQKLMPVMCEICGDFQQGDVPAHRAPGTNRPKTVHNIKYKPYTVLKVG